MTQTRTRLVAFTLGETLRDARRKTGLDQAELAAEMAASRNTISSYENDHFGPRGPKVMTLRAWAKACGVAYEEMVAGFEDVLDPRKRAQGGERASTEIVRPIRRRTSDPQGTRPDTPDYRPLALAA